MRLNAKIRYIKTTSTSKIDYIKTTSEGKIIV